MPTIERVSEPVTELFKKRAAEAGLDMEKTPQAVQLAIQALTATTVSPFVALLEDLPASARAFDWMACVFGAYQEWCSMTIVLDDDPATAPAWLPPTQAPAAPDAGPADPAPVDESPASPDGADEDTDR